MALPPLSTPIFSHLTPDDWFGFISPKNPFPVLHSILFAPLSLLQSLPLMTCFEKRVFPLHHRPQTKLSQVVTNSLGGYRLVGHIFKSFGHLDCIICLVHSD
jgi:hypothetical protein